MAAEGLSFCVRHVQAWIPPQIPICRAERGANACTVRKLSLFPKPARYRSCDSQISICRTVYQQEYVGEAFRLPRDGEPVPYGFYPINRNLKGKAIKGKARCQKSNALYLFSCNTGFDALQGILHIAVGILQNLGDIIALISGHGFLNAHHPRR